MSQQGEAGPPPGCFFALVEEAGREERRGRAVKAPSGIVAPGSISACGEGQTAAPKFASLYENTANNEIANNLYTEQVICGEELSGGTLWKKQHSGGRHRKLNDDALRRAVARDPYKTNVQWAKEFDVSVETIRRARIRLKLPGKRRMPAATINDALRVAEIHEFIFEPFAVEKAAKF